MYEDSDEIEQAIEDWREQKEEDVENSYDPDEMFYQWDDE
jgi:hypothetical protein